MYNNKITFLKKRYKKAPSMRAQRRSSKIILAQNINIFVLI